MMQKITLNENDIRMMVNEAIKSVGFQNFNDDMVLCRFPYPITIFFTKHAVDRRDERTIEREEIYNDVKSVIKDIVKDFEAGKFRERDRIRVINRDTCVITTATVNCVGKGRSRIRSVVVLTAFIFDGLKNLIDNGMPVYFTGEESERFREELMKNQEHRDDIIDYQDWKFPIKTRKQIELQRKKAEKEHYFRNNPYERGHDKTQKWLDRMGMDQAKMQKDRIHASLPDGDLQTINRFYKRMDKEHIPMEPLEDINESVQLMVRECVITELFNKLYCKRSGMLVETENEKEKVITEKNADKDQKKIMSVVKKYMKDHKKVGYKSHFDGSIKPTLNDGGGFYIDNYGTFCVDIYGGWNGCGEWEHYFECLNDFVKYLEKNGVHCWAVKMDNDCLDDVFTITFGVKIKKKDK